MDQKLYLYDLSKKKCLCYKGIFCFIDGRIESFGYKGSDRNIYLRDKVNK